MWKMARPTKAVDMYVTKGKDYVRYSEVFSRLLGPSGSYTNTKQLIYAEEALFSSTKVPAMVWAEKGLPVRVIGTGEKGGQ